MNKKERKLACATALHSAAADMTVCADFGAVEQVGRRGRGRVFEWRWLLLGRRKPARCRRRHPNQPPSLSDGPQVSTKGLVSGLAAMGVAPGEKVLLIVNEPNEKVGRSCWGAGWSGFAWDGG